jgi:hypothetical protein
MTPDEAVELVVRGRVRPEALSYPGRNEVCPSCGVSAWYAPRRFNQDPPSYYLCKWCGFRFWLHDGPEAATLALPVFHECKPGVVALTWHQFEGEPYSEKYWTCDCGARLRLIDTLRPFPRFATDPALVELPGS